MTISKVAVAVVLFSVFSASVDKRIKSNTAQGAARMSSEAIFLE